MNDIRFRLSDRSRNLFSQVDKLVNQSEVSPFKDKIALYDYLFQLGCKAFIMENEK